MAKQRQVRIEPKNAMAAMQALETKSDEELERETKFKAVALSILGARAAERYDAKAARAYFQRALAAARPQERMQIRRMADASLALAERRADDLKDAVTKLGQKPPSGRELFILRLMGLIAPPESAGTWARVRGGLMLIGIVLVLLLIGFLVVSLVALPFGEPSVGVRILLGFLVVAAALGVLALVGRRRQAKAREKARANAAS